MSKGNSKSNNKSNGKSNGNGNSNGNSNGFLISENQNPEISAASTASLSRTFYVSLDNADKVIEGAPLFRVLCERVSAWRHCGRQTFARSHERPIAAGSERRVGSGSRRRSGGILAFR